MLAADPDKTSKIDRIIEGFGDHALTLSHARHISFEQAKELSVKVVPLEDDPDLQDAVPTVRHACIQTLSDTGCIKLIENQERVACIRALQMAAFQLR